MTIEEMRKRIEEKCYEYGRNIFYCTHKCPLRNVKSCYTYATDEQIKNNYKLMFGKEESKMKNEFDFNELKAGMAIKTLDSDELIIGVQMKNDIVFFNKNYTPIISKKNIVDKIYSENFEVLEIYGFSNSNFDLFDPSTGPLLWKKEEDMNFKIYKIGNLEIKPNYEGKEDGYKTEKEDFLFIECPNETEYVCINKSELNNVIDTLTEIRDFVEEDE